MVAYIHCAYRVFQTPLFRRMESGEGAGRLILPPSPGPYGIENSVDLRGLKYHLSQNQFSPLTSNVGNKLCFCLLMYYELFEK